MSNVSARVVGQSVDRVDGRLKVTGRATYAYETSLDRPAAYGVILGAGVARGRIAWLDTGRAERVPGVLLVLTHRNVARQPEFGVPVPPTVPEVFTRARPVLAGDVVQYFDQPMALVVADTLEAARGAAALIEARYEAEPGAFAPLAADAASYRPQRLNAGFEPDKQRGDPDAALAAAPVTLDEHYVMPFEHHNPMEPHATLARWDGDMLVLHTGTQTVANIQAGVAATLSIPREKVRVISPFIGGGFGSKLIPHADAVLAALASRALGRPVKVALTRQQMFANAGHRPAMAQRIRLGANREGRLAAIIHDVRASTARFEEFAEQSAVCTRHFYAASSRRTTHRLVHTDINRGEWMRAPGEASGLFALECAMDEMAERLSLDPIEFRLRNEPTIDPEMQRPFSSRNLVACMQEGARRFSWDSRPRPGSRVEGRLRIGYGMAAAMRPNYIGPTAARVAVNGTGQVTVQTDMTDIGTGTYTVLAQIAAERLGVPVEAVVVQLGDSTLPRSAGSGGSWGAASAGSAVHEACLALCRDVLARTGRPGLSAEAGMVSIEGRMQPVALLAARLTPAGMQAEGRVERGENYQNWSQNAFGAHFAEVAVDGDTGEVRLRRMLGVFAAGRLLNPKMARSQVIGGMIWGIGAALMEEAVLDPRYGHFVNADLAGYHVPSHADIPDIEAVFLEEEDDKGNPLGIKGIGELGSCGASAAVINAVYNATGVRVRELPVTMEKLLR
jgi:xanthine dehydrogenase YagR molybdenum-binding subunit